MKERKPLIRIIPLKEIASCQVMRLDPKHYIPRHRRRGCKKGNRLRSREALVKAWLNGEISSEELLEAVKAG